MACVLILGGGPAGLAAAHRLALLGIRCIVLEKEKTIGGLSRTIEHNAFRFDLGPHKWYTSNPELDLWFKTLMNDELVEVNRRSGIYFEGKMFDYPVRAGSVLRNADVLTIFHVMGSYFAARFKRLWKPAAPKNMEDAYTRQFGKKLYEMFFKAYSEKIWGDSCRTISSDWVDQRTFGLSVVEIIRKALLKSSQSRRGLVEPMRFFYPRHGYGRICQRMAEEVCKKGGSVLVNHAVSDVVCEENGIAHIDCMDEHGDRKSIDCDAVISTIPLTLLTRILKPASPESVKTAATRLKFRSLITINIMINREQVLKENWVYLNDSRVPFARVSEPKNFSRELAPPGKTLLVVELFCSKDDQSWNQQDASLSDLAVHHLSKMKWIEEREVLGTFLCRLPNAYPVYDLDYKKNLKIVQDYVASIPNLFIAGRGGTFHYHTSDVSLEMGFSCAENLLTRLPSFELDGSMRTV
ncbi:FAD-dependent oxidoreductase [bacterium]|nr:FAD-dependent oxidoreductase [bacterium]